MAEPFIGEIRPFAFGFIPRDWVICNGQILQISQYQALFTILYNRFGGDGRTTFGVPDLRGLVPISSNSNFPLASYGGVPSVTLNSNNIPPHTHTFNGATSSVGSAGEVTTPNGNSYLSNLFINSATPVGARAYQHLSTTPPTHNLVALNANTIKPSCGTSATNPLASPHDNMTPYLTINFCICTYGNYPPFNN